LLAPHPFGYHKALEIRNDILLYIITGMTRISPDKRTMTRGKERVMKDALNPFQIAQRQLDDAAQRLGLDPAMHELLRWPMQELKVILWYALF
jgi:hypothetical protein